MSNINKIAKKNTLSATLRFLQKHLNPVFEEHNASTVSVKRFRQNKNHDNDFVLSYWNSYMRSTLVFVVGGLTFYLFICNLISHPKCKACRITCGHTCFREFRVSHWIKGTKDIRAHGQSDPENTQDNCNYWNCTVTQHSTTGCVIWI